MITPIEKYGNIYVKRDDLFEIAGVRGGKARTCWELSKDAVGLVTAGSRSSPQVNIVAHIAEKLGISCRVHVPQGEFTPELISAANRETNVEIIQHFPGYNTVICKRAIDDAKALNWTYIPFGMECTKAVDETAKQVINIPLDINRIVVPVGSGMTLCGILQGLKDNKLDIPVIGVVVGASPKKRVEKYFGYAPNLTYVYSPYKYHEYSKDVFSLGLLLDPIYEAKTVPYLKDGDLLWVVGIRQSFVDELNEGWYEKKNFVQTDI